MPGRAVDAARGNPRGEFIHAFVSGFGTGGTLLGVARGLKAADPGIRVIAAEPDNSPLLGSGVRQVRDADGQPAASHPRFRPHLCWMALQCCEVSGAT